MSDMRNIGRQKMPPGSILKRNENTDEVAIP